MDIHDANQFIKKLKGKFTKIPNYIIAKQELSDGAFRTYVAIKSFKFYEGQVFPSRRTLAQLRGKSERTISKHVQELQAKKLLLVKKRGFSKSNMYSFIDEENFTNGEINGVKNCSSLENKTSPLISQKLPTNNTKVNKTKINKVEKNSKTGMELLRRTMNELGIKK